ncbi:hypothetical protein [Leptolyngbya sp. FACHB-16]|uniref:DUF6929 family protein n=1 Tax=unclassified Leptolyngbya TaxID=2650499 RepID=UPI0016823D62|nr:hypothetical protein [Leptolyngbya sp. FACHB-16]MBD2158914.1 hypothetical protein [Leptolyngbya sp. FACHB-16]
MNDTTVSMIQAKRDPTLKAIVQKRIPLFYSQGADATSDRPAHVRAGSSLSWLGDKLALIQDDANFLVFIDPESLTIEAITLAAGEAGARQFDDLRGNKRFKLDLEACTTVPTPSGDLFLAFGSGSTAQREQILMVQASNPSNPELKQASALYAQLRAYTSFSGSELNIEGAIFQDGQLRLFNRGNGKPNNNRVPVNATVDLDWNSFSAYLDTPEHHQPPALQNVCQYDLGKLHELSLSFTDAIATQKGIIFSAAAEDSPDVTSDGRVTGSVLGILDANPRWIELRAPDGSLFTGKVEGICAFRNGENRLWIVIDADDPMLPCELCEVEFIAA